MLGSIPSKDKKKLSNRDGYSSGGRQGKTGESRGGRGGEVKEVKGEERGVVPKANLQCMSPSNQFFSQGK